MTRGGARRLVLASVVTAGLLGTLALFVRLRSEAMGRLHDRFTGAGTMRTVSLELAMEAISADLASFAALVQGPDVADPRQLAEFLRLRLARHRTVHVLAWAPLGSEGRLRIRYAAPPEEQREWGGLDLAATPEVLRAIEQARDSGTTVAVPVPPKIAPERGAAYFILAPLYVRDRPLLTPAQRRNAFVGCVLAIARPPELLHATLDAFTEAITVTLEDRSAPGRAAWSHYGAGGPATPASAGAPLLIRREFTAVGRHWRVSVAGGQAYFRAQGWPAYWLALPAGALLTFLFALYLRAVLTQRERAEALVEERTAALRANEERLRLALTAADVAVFSQDRDLRYRWMFNPQLGYTSEEVVGRTDAELLPAQDAPVVSALKRRVLETGEGAHQEVAVHLPDRTLHYDLIVEPLKGPDGAVVGVLAASRDVTERVRADAERARLSAAIEQAAEGVIITGTDGAIVYVNPAFERLSGWTLAEVQGQNPRILNSGKQGPEVYEDLWATLLRGETWRGAMVNRRKNGELYTAEAVISPVRDSAGCVVNYVGLQRDVTRERILDEQLRQSQKMEAIGQLTGGIAHDFNNLLTVIIANAALAQGELPKEMEEVRGYLTDLETAARRGSGTVRKLLAFGRRERLSLVPLDLGAAVADFARVLRHFLPENITVRLELQQGDGAVLADAGAIEQIVLNLATNARDAMPSGGTLTLSVGRADVTTEDLALGLGVERPGSYVTLAVTDTGTGIDAPVRARIFEPFFTTKPPGAGTGLGLPMVLGLIEQHKGFVHIDSEPGKGTAVRLYFPTTEQEGLAPGERGESAPTRGGTETILVVEDEDALRQVASRALAKFGYTVLLAPDGEEGWETWQAKERSIAIVVSDVVMPRLGGPELLARIRKAGSNVPVLLVTGYAGRELPEGGQPGALVEVMTKPWTATDLARRVRGLLDAAAAGRR
jgi:PAS domain S-box-containing protein